jgi:hypothetical protein
MGSSNAPKQAFVSLRRDGTSGNTGFVQRRLPGQEAADLWQTSRRRLMIAGGDWQIWIAKMPDRDTKTWARRH